MKTKLLKKVRRNFRIVKDGNGYEFLQERYIFGWTEYTTGYEIHFINQLYPYENNYELLLAIFDFRYSKYKFKNRVKEFRSKKLTKIWYK